MAIRFECDCGKSFSVKDERAGKRVKCSECGDVLTVPAKSRRESKSGSSRKSGAGPSRKRGKSNSRKRQPNRTPLIAGGAIAAVLLIGVLVWVLWPGEKNNAPDGGEELARNDGAGIATPNENSPDSRPSAPGSQDGNATGSGSPVAPVQVTPVTNGQMPRSLKELPASLAEDAPFDLDSFWITVPPETNAAPLYLDAMYEFSPLMETCFPEDIRAQRTAAVRDRADRFLKFQIARETGKGSRGDAELDAMLREYSVAYQKLVLAQQRPNCVFEIGWDSASSIPLVFASRSALRFIKLKVEREVALGRFDQAVASIGVALRFSRDLRRRTPSVYQAVAQALDSLAFQTAIIPILRSPKLPISHCDQLIKLLTQHEATLEQINPYLTGLRGDYIIRVLLLQQMRDRSGELADNRFQNAFGSISQTRGQAVLSALNLEVPAVGLKFPTELIPMFDTLVEGLTPSHYAEAIAGQKSHYTQMAAMAGKLYATQVDAFKQIENTRKQTLTNLMSGVTRETPKDQAARLIQDRIRQGISNGTVGGPMLNALLVSQIEQSLEADNLIEGHVRSGSRLSAMIGLVAVRRWYATRSEYPSDIALVCRESGLERVPHDYYGNQPIKMAVFQNETSIKERFPELRRFLAGETVVYSVAPDGKDDGAVVRWTYVPGTPGDFVFAMGLSQNQVPRAAQ